MLLRIKCLTPEVRKMYEDHAHFHPGDAGIDLFLPEDITLDPDARGQSEGFGIQCEMLTNTPQTHFGSCSKNSYHPCCVPKSVPYLLIPRSSISKTMVRQSNSIGLVDAGYRGELKALLDNVTPWEARTESEVASRPVLKYSRGVNLKKGTRLFQIVAMDGSPLTIELVDELSDSARGEDGVGSTGI